MNDVVGTFQEQYTRVLQEYLVRASEGELHRAYELGRRALTDGLGVLEVASVYHRALLVVLTGRHTPDEMARLIKAGETFFAESLSPFEMSHRGSREAALALRRLNETMEEEARRIAHALHDEAGQLLASVHISLDMVARELPTSVRDRFLAVRGLLDRAEEQLRRLSHELRPTILDNLGLRPALEFLVQGISKRAGLPITVEGSTDGRLPTPVEIALYRIVQEALNNVTKHAQARHAAVCLQRGAGLIQCTIADDGVGFDVQCAMDRKPEQGLGLIGIRERLHSVGGTHQIISAPGRGTTVRVEIPLEA